MSFELYVALLHLRPVLRKKKFELLNITSSLIFVQISSCTVLLHPIICHLWTHLLRQKFNIFQVLMCAQNLRHQKPIGPTNKINALFGVFNNNPKNLTDELNIAVRTRIITIGKTKTMHDFCPSGEKNKRK